MNVFTFAALKDELQKTAEGWMGPAADIAGLGVLAAPTIAKMRHKPMSKKNENRSELGGLGILAGTSAAGIAKHLLTKKASVDLVLVNSALSLFTKKAAKMDNRMASPKPSISSAGKVRDPKIQPLVGDEADWAARTNLVSIRGGSDSGRVIPTANQMKTAAARIKRAAVNWGVSTGKVRDLAGKVVSGVAGVAGAAKKPQFTLQHLQQAYQKSGVKPGLGSAVKAVAHT